jgi:hypothetical protein
MIDAWNQAIDEVKRECKLLTPLGIVDFLKKPKDFKF